MITDNTHITDENILSQRITLCLLKGERIIILWHLISSFVGLFAQAKFVLFEDWKFHIFNITLQKFDHAIRVRAWMGETALMKQEEPTAASARADTVVKYVKVCTGIFADAR